MKLNKRISLLCLAFWAGATWAQTSPYSLGVAQTVSRDSYMQRYGGSGADWISSTGLRLGVDQAFGRQQLVVDGSVNRNLYRRNGTLDNTDYALDAKLNWATVERLSGTLALQSSQSLYKNLLTTQVLGRNLLRNDGATFTAQLGLVTMWTFDAGLSTNRQRIKGSSAFDYLNTDQRGVNAGLRWSPTPDLSVRVGGRRTKGRIPTLGDDFTRNDLDVSGIVALSGLSSINARVSSTRVDHTLAGLTDVRGWTGRLAWDWQATGKVKLGLSATRDSSFGSVDQSGALVSTNSNTSRLTNTYALTANWEATSKIFVDSRLSYMRRSFDTTTTATLLGLLSSTNAATGQDTIQSLSLGLRYLPVRNAELGCGFSVDQHRNSSSVILVQDYNARVVYCSGQLYLR